MEKNKEPMLLKMQQFCPISLQIRNWNPLKATMSRMAKRKDSLREPLDMSFLHFLVTGNVFMLYSLRL